MAAVRAWGGLDNWVGAGAETRPSCQVGVGVGVASSVAGARAARSAAANSPHDP